MPMQDPTGQMSFSLSEMTAAINILPNQYGRINQLGLFPISGIATRTFLVDEQDGALSILRAYPVGAPAPYPRDDSRRVRSFVIPHFPIDDVVKPEEIAGIRSFGGSQLETIANRMNEKLQRHRNHHDQTLEYLRVGALKGIVMDGTGQVLLNLFTEYGITQTTINFPFSVVGTNVRELAMLIMRTMEDNLQGEIMSGVRVLVSPEFMNALTRHSSVEAAYANHQGAQQMMGGDLRAGFTFGGITFEEYRGVGSPPGGGTPIRFIPASEGYAFPLGTSNSFRTIAAPADFNETVNTIGIPYYAKAAERIMQRGYDLHSQSNVLPICLRPKLLIKLTMS